MRENAPYIYLVDDSDINLKTITNYIKKRFDCNVRPFKSAEECWKIIKKRKPNIVLSDYHLNDFNKKHINGDKLLLKVKKQYPNVSTLLYSSDHKMNNTFISRNEFPFIPRDHDFNVNLFTVVNSNLKTIKKEEINKNTNFLLYSAILFWIAGFYLTSIEKEPFAVLTFFIALVLSIIYSNKKIKKENLT